MRSEPRNRASRGDFRLLSAVAGAIVVALALTVIVSAPKWPKPQARPTRFLGLDEPVEPMPKSP